MRVRCWVYQDLSEEEHLRVVSTVAQEIGLPLHLDDELLFWAQHFDGKNWATYENGARKGGTLRFKQGHVRVPKWPVLPVFESEERKRNRPFPCAFVEIRDLTMCAVGELTAEEMHKDGFENHAHVVDSMKKYYPTIALDSIVSFYEFGQTVWNDKKDFRYSRSEEIWVPKRIPDQ